MNFSKYVLESPEQNVSAGDINLVGALALQNLKNFNVYILSQLDCVIAGLQVVAPGSPTTGSVTVKAGYALYSTPTATTTIPSSNPSIVLSYKGSVIEITTDLTVSVPSPDPSQDRIDAIDLIYTEIAGIPSSRNFIDPGTGIIAPQTTNTQILGNSVQNPGSANTNILYTTGTPGASPVPPAIPTNAIRLALIRVTAGGTFNITQNNITQSGSTGTTGISGTLPRLFEMQNFPSNAGNPLFTPGANQPDQSVSIADSLASIRYQINQMITGGIGNWYNATPITLPQLLIWGGIDAGTTNNYNISIANFPSTLVPGMRVFFKATNGNTGNSFLVVNAGASIAIKDSLGNDISASSIQVNQRVLLFYDGTYWIMPYLDVGVAQIDGLSIPNGSFEFWNGSQPKQWSTPTITQFASISQEFSSIATDGGSALKVSTGTGGTGSGGGSAAVTSTMIPVSPQSNYYVKFKTYSSSAALPGSVTVSFYDYQGIFISTANLWLPPGSIYPTSWSTYYGIVQSNNVSISPPTNVLAPAIPSSARFMAITVSGGANGGASNQSTWFDAVKLFIPAAQNKTIFLTATGLATYRTDSNCIALVLDMVGGGAGGGDDSGGTGAGGGGGGAYNRVYSPVNPDTVYSYTVGIGGPGGPDGTSATGSPGGSTIFNTITVPGGLGGHGVGNAGGAGGVAIAKNLSTILAAVNGSAGTNGTGPFSNAGGPGGAVNITDLRMVPFTSVGGATNGGNASGKGAGGGGANGSGGGGGNGSAGIIIIYC